VGLAGVVGPQLISWVKDSTGEYTNAFYIIAGIMLLSAIVPFIVRPPKREVTSDTARFQREEAGERAGVSSR
jgi:nitrate/nitrite transporter NarK